MYERILTTVDFINKKTNNFHPEVGVVLGSGLGGLANGIAVECAIPYSDINGEGTPRPASVWQHRWTESHRHARPFPLL